jgi:glutathione S-transferase
MSDLELFSMPLCPFAHRVRLVLEEKAIAYRLTEIALSNKPQAFLKVSLCGKVPAPRHGDRHICESAIINEYLDETFSDPPLPAGTIRMTRTCGLPPFATASLRRPMDGPRAARRV